MSETATFDLEALAVALAAIEEPASSQAEVTVQIRFKPDGKVLSTNERPVHVDPQVWFDLLCKTMPEAYQALSGGRGAFRLSTRKLLILRGATA
jgi:hypothetical protein